MLQAGDKFEVTLYVLVDEDEGPGEFNDIHISATSEQDGSTSANTVFKCEVVRPNLKIEDDDIRINPVQGIEEDDTIEVIARVHNTGNTESDEFHAYLYEDKSDSDSDPDGLEAITVEGVDSIPAGGYRDVYFFVDIEKGENDFYVYVDKPTGNDYEGDIIEEVEYDNDATLPKEYKDAIHLMPDLRIDDIEWRPLNPEKGEEVEFTVTLGNYGTADYDSKDDAKITLKVDILWIGGSSGSRISQTIRMDRSDEVSFTWTEGPVEWNEEYRIKVYIDFDDDLDIDNNRGEMTLQSSAKPSDSNTPDYSSVGAVCGISMGLLFGLGILAIGGTARSIRTVRSPGTIPPFSIPPPKVTGKDSSPPSRITSPGSPKSTNMPEDGKDAGNVDSKEIILNDGASDGKEKDETDTTGGVRGAAARGKSRPKDGVGEKMKFPLTMECPECELRVKINEPGEFKCSVCREKGIVDEYGYVCAMGKEMVVSE